MKHFTLPPLTQSSEREGKYTILLLIFVFAVLIIANGFIKVNILEWFDVEKKVVYDEYAVLGSTTTIKYYLVNDRPFQIMVKPLVSFSISLSYSSDSYDREKTHVHSTTPSEKYITIPANDEFFHSLETIKITKTGLLYVKKTTFPDVTINIVEAFETQLNVSVGLDKFLYDFKDTPMLVIWNDDSHEITFGSPYTIEKLVGETWVEISPFPPNGAWAAGLRICKAGETTTQEINIDTLESGRYRISKTLNHERTQTELTFILEFRVGVWLF